MSYVAGKNVSDMTFKEFIGEGKKQGVLQSELEDEMLGRMHEEGFTDDEIYNMPMSRIWKLFSEVVIDFMTDGFSKDNKAVLNPDILNNPTVKKTLEALKKSIKGLEE